MFGFKKKKNDAAQAQQGEVIPGELHPAMAANAVQVISSFTGFTTLNVGTRNWLSLPDIGLDLIDYPGLTVRIDTIVEEGELYTDGVLEWYGVLNEVPEDEVLRAVNAFKEKYAMPRLFVYTDEAGNRRLRAQVLWDWPVGYTVGQMRSFVEVLYYAARVFADWVQEQWPDAPLESPIEGYVDGGAMIEGNESDVTATEQMLAQFITPGNDYGLASGPTYPVTLERIVNNFASRTGNRSPILNGALIPIRWEHQDIDIQLSGDFLSISAVAHIRAMDQGSEAILLNRLNAWSTNRAGLSVNLYHTEEDSWQVRYISVRKIGAGMTEQQLTHHLRGTCMIIAANFQDILS